MALINHARKEISLKIVYWGTGLGGKTVNVMQLSKLFGGKEPIQLSTEEGRTLFFDFKPLEIKLSNGYKLRYSVYTAPGQVIYRETRKLLLKGVDGIVFVADSQISRHESNIISLKELLNEMKEQKLSLDIPIVFQYNKRDLSNILSVKILRKDLNFLKRPDFRAIAIKGIGVRETFNEVAKLSFLRVITNLTSFRARKYCCVQKRDMR